ncbi:MAG: dienelactone hydrolase family protein [Candidatus Sedimenticola sp. PURPLELP]
MCDLYSCGSESSSQRPLPTVSLDERRAFLQGLATLPLAVILADPLLAQAAGESVEEVSITLASGKTARAVVALPEGVASAPTVLLIHEWWGLNDQIKAVTREFAQQGFIALAVDLYNGKVATSREEAQAYRKGMDSKWATEALVGWVDWLRKHDKGNGKVGTLGWCFGGGWSLNASLATPVDATVVYYGNVKKSAGDLASLQSPLLGHFGTQDKWINAEMVDGFEKAMTEAGKSDLTVHWYEANHAFANPTGARYDEDDAKLSWERTMTFLHKHLAG